ncbi:MAG: hypothetical protein NTV42_04965 [Chloroflexi bacterium]|nr:hypothetical protein [Chloroflexota bacterium]
MDSDELKQVRDTVTQYFPTLWEPVDAVLSVTGAAVLSDLSHCIGLILQDQPSSSKTTVLDLLGDKDPIHIEPNFTPASFVSQYAGVAKADLDKIDLLPRIKHKILVTKEMAGFFGQRSEDLLSNIAALTEIFDGRGYQRSSGVHGQRGYRGDYRFCMIGATTPLEHRVWQILGKLGSRWVLYRMPGEKITTQKLADEMAGDYRSKIETTREKVSSFIVQLWQKYGGFGSLKWDSEKDVPELRRTIAAIAIKVCSWRGLQLRQDTVGYNPAMEEVPRRLSQTLILSPKTGPNKMLVLWDDNIRKGGSFHEKVEVHRGANRLCAEAGGVRHTYYRGVPQDGHL